MKSGERYGFGWLAVVLAVGVIVRLSPALFEIPLGRDIIEYRNIAENLQKGKSFTLDIKAYHAVATPVRHYSGYDRAPLFPLVLRGLQFFLSPEMAGRVVGPALFLLILILAYDLVQRAQSAQAAFWTGLLVAVHPNLVEISLIPLTEILTLFLLTLALWGYFRRESPLLTGLACALAFMTHPSSLLVSVVFGAAYFLRFSRQSCASSRFEFPIFLGMALLGPIGLAVINFASGAPIFLTPQNFLLRELSFTDHLHYFHQGRVYSSTWALLADQPGAVIKKILKNGYYYLKTFGGTNGGLGILLPGLVLASCWIAIVPRARRYFLPAALALTQLAFITCIWPTFDAERFLGSVYLNTIFFTGLGISIASSALKERIPDSPARHAMTVFLSTVILLWLVQDADRSYQAWREWTMGSPYSNNLEALWQNESVKNIENDLKILRDRGAFTDDTIIASNEPWLAHQIAHCPTVIIPYDLERNEWMDFLDRWKARYVLIHRGDWPNGSMNHLNELEQSLAVRQWKRIPEQGELDLWQNPHNGT